jgi:hypothetical protein
MRPYSRQPHGLHRNGKESGAGRQDAGGKAVEAEREFSEEQPLQVGWL